MRIFSLLSLTVCLWAPTQLVTASYNYQDGVFLHKQLKEIESGRSPDREFVDRGYAINSLANQAKHPKDYEYANFSQSVNALGREFDPDFYDRAQQINKLASEAKQS